MGADLCDDIAGSVAKRRATRHVLLGGKVGNPTKRRARVRGRLRPSPPPRRMPATSPAIALRTVKRHRSQRSSGCANYRAGEHRRRRRATAGAAPSPDAKAARLWQGRHIRRRRRRPQGDDDKALLPLWPLRDAPFCSTIHIALGPSTQVDKFAAEMLFGGLCGSPPIEARMPTHG